MRYEEIIGEIDVCEDCMHAHNNGEHGEREPGEPEVWALLTFGYSVTMGGEHSDECTEADRAASCDCDDRGFSMAQCEGCGSYLGGDRYRFTMWRATTESAHVRARAAIQRARTARVAGDRVAMTESLASAAEWRGYLAERAAEDRRFSRWLWNTYSAR